MLRSIAAEYSDAGAREPMEPEAGSSMPWPGRSSGQSKGSQAPNRTILGLGVSMEVPLGDILLGFRTTLAPGWVKVAVVAALLVGLALLILAGYLIKTARERRHRRLLAERLYERRVAEAGLTGEDRRLLDALAARLDRPLEQKHRMLADPGLFHKAAARAIEGGAASEEEVAALRVGLGLAHVDTHGIVRSSTELPAGYTISLELEGSGPIDAVVIESALHALVVRTDTGEGAGLPPAGSAIGVSLKAKAGSFRFDTVVMERAGSILHLAHTEHVAHEQARRFYRRAMETPATVRDIRSGIVFPARLADLSGGGASLDLPPGGPRIQEGQDVELRLELAHGKPIVAAARVIRLSGGGSRFHVAFFGLSVNAQDRLVEHVLS